MSTFTFRRPFGGVQPWQRNLYVLALALGVIIAAFDMSYPFAPLFVRELGVEDPGQAALWSGVINLGSSMALFLSGPMWGAFADRYGRKPNVLRAAFGSAVLTALAALSGDVFQLAGLRIATGLVSGVLAAMMGLAAANAPPGRAGFSMGIMQMSLFIGSTMGPVAGGFLADAFGFRAPFVVAGVAVAGMGALVLLFVSEDFTPPVEERRSLSPLTAYGDVARFILSPGLAPLFLLQFLTQLAPIVIAPVLPLFLQELSPRTTGAREAGIAFSAMGIAAAVSALAFARLSDRISPKRVVVLASLWAMLFSVLGFSARKGWHLIAVSPFLGAAEGAATSAMGALFADAAGGGRQGRAFGAVQSANSTAWGIGPLLGGATAARFGLRWAFLTCAGAFAVAAAVAQLAAIKKTERPPEEGP